MPKATAAASNRTPVWGWFILLPSFAALVVLLSFAGASFVFPTGAWFEGIAWALAAAVGLYVVLSVSRVRGGLAPVLSLCLFLCVSAGVHLAYYQDRISKLQIALAEDNSELPEAWQALDRETAYERYMQRILSEPDAAGWFDHLRTQATVGTIRSERQPRTQFGKIERKGQDMWLGWFTMHGFLAVGCLVGMAGGLPR